MEVIESALELVASILKILELIRQSDKYKTRVQKKYINKLVRKYTRLCKKIQKEQKALMPIIPIIREIINEQE